MDEIGYELSKADLMMSLHERFGVEGLALHAAALAAASYAAYRMVEQACPKQLRRLGIEILGEEIDRCWEAAETILKFEEDVGTVYREVTRQIIGSVREADLARIHDAFLFLATIWILIVEHREEQGSIFHAAAAAAEAAKILAEAAREVLDDL